MEERQKAEVKKVKTTSKKVKVIGKEEYINTSTGEVQEMSVILVEERDFNFHKIWLEHIIRSIELIGSQKTKLAFWIIDHLDYENKLVYTYEQIRKETKMSLDTIRRTMQLLIDSDFLKKKHSGCYIVNPNIVYKGSHQNRMNILIQYRDMKAEKIKKAEEKNAAECSDAK